jgi:hypothetical protein
MGIWRISPDPEIVVSCDRKGCLAEYDSWYDFRRLGKFGEDGFLRALGFARRAGWEIGSDRAGHYHLCPKHARGEPF